MNDLGIWLSGFFIGMLVTSLLVRWAYKSDLKHGDLIKPTLSQDGNQESK